MNVGPNKTRFTASDITGVVFYNFFSVAFSFTFLETYSMAFLKYFLRVKKLDDLINRKATGSPATLAKKMNLSRSVVMDYLHDMKKLGFPIKFSKHRNSYYYEENNGEGDKLATKMLSMMEQNKLKGGHFYPYKTSLNPHLPATGSFISVNG